MLVTDSKRGTFQKLALSSTPLAIFLAEHIRLDKGAHVTRVDRDAGGFSVTARGSPGLGNGQIVIYFAEGPLKLTGWVVVDAQNKLTRVTLGPLTAIATPPASFFTQAAG